METLFKKKHMIQKTFLYHVFKKKKKQLNTIYPKQKWKSQIVERKTKQKQKQIWKSGAINTLIIITPSQICIAVVIDPPL